MMEKKSKNRKSKPLSPVILIMLVVVICAIGLAIFYAWFFLRDSSTTPIKETQTASELSYELGPFSDYARLPTAQSDLVISPDGRYIGYSYNERDIIIWDVLSRREFKKLQGHSDSIAIIDFSPKSTILASSSRDQVILWNLAQGTTIQNLIVNGVCEITFLDEDDTLGIYCPETNEISYVDGSTGKRIADQSGHLFEVSTIEFSAQENLLLRFGDSSPYLNIHKRGFYEPLATFSIDSLSELVCAKFLHDGGKVVAGYADGNVVIWEISSGEPIWQNQYNEESLVQQIFVSPNDSEPLVLFLKKDGTIDLLEVMSGSIRTIDQSFYTAAAFSPDNQLFALGNAYTMVELWKLNSSSPVQYLAGGRHAPPKKIIFSSSGDLLIVVPFEGETRIYQKK